jgi:hypothetical protein
MVYILAACGHGLLTVADDTDIFYQVSPIRRRGLGPARSGDPPEGSEANGST